jgi:hypothetical protein
MPCASMPYLAINAYGAINAYQGLLLPFDAYGLVVTSDSNAQYAFKLTLTQHHL